MRSTPWLQTRSSSLASVHLDREVKLEFILPPALHNSQEPVLLLINDGQHLEEMGLASMLEEHFSDFSLVCVGIHASPQRKMEYGVSGHPDYEGRGNLAGAYHSFVLEELLPYITQVCRTEQFRYRAFAGFSLGALMALDIVWKHPGIFTKAGLFSGSFWWRSIDQADPEYDDDKHRIMHQVIRKGQYHPGLKFFFQCGNMDETLDRNNNGIIDSIDDTLDLIRELEAKGYLPGKDIHYLEMPDGRHDIPTWTRAMPVFLDWLRKE